MNWSEFVQWTDTTASSAGDSWEALRSGLVEKCHAALAQWHWIVEGEWRDRNRTIVNGSPNEWQDEMRLKLQAVQDVDLHLRVGEACWYAARIVRLAGSSWSPLVNGDTAWSRLELMRKIDAPHRGEADGDWWAVEMVGLLLCATGVTLDKAIAGNVATRKGER